MTIWSAVGASIALVAIVLVVILARARGRGPTPTRRFVAQPTVRLLDTHLEVQEAAARAYEREMMLARAAERRAERMRSVMRSRASSPTEAA